jgi:Flp pilus assembly protein TadG
MSTSTIKTEMLHPRTPKPIRNRKGLDRAGAYTVEFAICVSVFFTTIFGCFELARYGYVQQSLDQTAYDACREGIVSGATVGDITDRANELLSAYGVSVADIQVTPATIDEDTLEVSVTITCNFSDNSWVLPDFITDDAMTSTITLDHENRAFLKNEEATDDSDLTNNDEPQDV